VDYNTVSLAMCLSGMLVVSIFLKSIILEKYFFMHCCCALQSKMLPHFHLLSFVMHAAVV